MNNTQKLAMHTPSLADSNFAALAALFPNVVTETIVGYEPVLDKDGNPVVGLDGIPKESAIIERSIDADVLAQELNSHVVSGKEERYQFTWPDKKKSILLSNAPIAAALRPCREESVDFDTTENLYIEGDNLDVLKLLRETYLNRVKMIYIDPPYNTSGNFIYSDDFSEDRDTFLGRDSQYDEQGNRLVKNLDSNGRFHTDWLNMLYPRLSLSRELLSEDGVIFISIDDNEVENLKKICNEIFGSENFIGILSVENNPKGRKNSAFVSVSSEYCVIYAKHKDSSHFIENVPKKASDMTQDEDGNYVHGSGKRVLVGENSFNNYVTKAESEKNYSVYYRSRDRQLRIIKEAYGIVDQGLISDDYVKYCSFNNGRLVENTYTENKFRELFERRALDFSADKIYEKNFSDTIRIKSQLVNREYEAIVRGQKQNYSMELTTTGAGTYIKNLFEVAESPFSAPKNVGYLKVLISLFENEPFTVLDFFSGSGTTADAVIQLNAEDGGKRKFIMVQLPEDLDENLEKAGSAAEKQTIQSAISVCDNLRKPHHLTEIGKERIRRAGAKIKADSPLTTGSLDVGFRVLKLDSSNMKDVYYKADEMAQIEMNLDGLTDNIKPDRTDEDLLFQVMIDLGIPLSAKIKQDGKMFTVDGNYLIACFGRVDTALITEIAKKQPYYAVFRDSSFINDSAMVNFEQVFATYSPSTIRRVL